MTVNHRHRKWHLSEEVTLSSCIALFYVSIHVGGQRLTLPLWSSSSPTVTCFFLCIYLSNLGSGSHFVSTRLCCVVTGDCVALRVRTAARWSGLGSTKRWCQQMEATRPPVCSVISQTNPNASNWNPLAPVCVLYDPVYFGASCDGPPIFTLLFPVVWSAEWIICNLSYKHKLALMVHVAHISNK